MIITENTSLPDMAAAIIVKDAAASIERAIKSVAVFCRQIVVVDTGSLDSTPSICTRLGAELHFHQWNDDFSEARNYGLNFIRTDWVLVIDSDEELDGETFKSSLHLFYDDKVGGIKVKLLNFLDENDSHYKSEHTYTRIFRNEPGIRFTGTIHEQIADSILAAGYETVESGVQILHYGYALNSKDKINRNKELLKKELEKNNEDMWLMFHLAETEFTDGNVETAEELFRNILTTGEVPLSYQEKSGIRLAQIALGKNNFNEAEQFTSFSSTDVNLEGLRKFVLGAVCLVKKDFARAAEFYNSPEVSISNLVARKELKKSFDLLDLIKKERNGIF